METWDAIVASFLRRARKDNIWNLQGIKTFWAALIQIPSKTAHKGTGTQVNNNIFIKWLWYT